QRLVEVELPYVFTLSYNEVLSVLDEATDSKSYLGIMHQLTKRLAPDRGAVAEVALDRKVANEIWSRYQDMLDDTTVQCELATSSLSSDKHEDIDQTLTTLLSSETDEGRLA